MAKAARFGKPLNKCTESVLRGSRDSTQQQEGVERERPRSDRAIETGRPRPKAEAVRLSEESEKLVVPLKAVKAAGGKGLHLGLRLAQ
jgi:hypothetical protein